MSSKELNSFMFSVVNQLTVEEFKKYTNFPSIIQAIVSQKPVNQLDKYIELNFKKNIPKKSLWMAGGFSSLKLTDEFYESETATRIFQKIFGVTEIRINLDPIEVETAIIANRMEFVESKSRKKSVSFHPNVIQNTLAQDPLSAPNQTSGALNVASSSFGKKAKPIQESKYPRKTAPKQIFGARNLATSAECSVGVTANGIHARPKHQSKTGSYQSMQPQKIGVTSCGGFGKPISVEKSLDEHKARIHGPITSIPFQNVACYMDQSDIKDIFRKTFYNRLQHIENEFEIYMADTEFNSLSLEHFWQNYVAVDWGHNVAIPQVQTKIKLEEEAVNETSVGAVLGYENFELDVQVASSPGNLIAIPDNNNRADVQPPKNGVEFQKSDDLSSQRHMPPISISSQSDGNCKVVAGTINCQTAVAVDTENKRCKRLSSNVFPNGIPAKRKRLDGSKNYQEEYFKFLSSDSSD